MPTALGQAIPHGEAWLLDDAEAVKKVLGLAAMEKVPGVKNKRGAKALLEEMLARSPRKGERPTEVWRELAGTIREKRCRAPRATGFAAFAADLRREFSSLAARERTR